MKFILCSFILSISLVTLAGDISSGGDDIRSPLATGYIEAIGQNVSLTKKSRVIIRVLDVSVADGKAVTVLKQEIQGVKSFAHALHFVLDNGLSLDPNASYNVAVHVDVDGDGKVSRADLVSEVAHPVSAKADPLFINVKAVK